MERGGDHGDAGGQLIKQVNTEASESIRGYWHGCENRQ